VNRDGSPGEEPLAGRRGTESVEDRPPAEAELVSRARRGDADAYAGLVAAHQEMAFRTAYLVLGDAAEAEDAAQEAFVKAYRALGRFRDGEPFRPWLLRITVNAARNRRRAAGRRAGLQLRAESAAGNAVAGSPEQTVLEAERRRELLDAVNALPPDDRLVIGARYFLDLGEAEIAMLAGVPRGTVKSRLFRAKARLARQLGGTRESWTDG
jgi:RNA polymerase sigma factor (sigma-70 family)